jgi:hypothetical protein
MAKLKGKIALIAGGACNINLLVAKEFIKVLRKGHTSS